MAARAIDDSGVVETLDEVALLHASRTDIDARLFELAAHFADLHPLPSDRPSGVVRPGMERSVQIGGEGTPKIAEFAYAELGARMQMGTWAAKRYVADALGVRHRLPLTWVRVQAREARIGYVRLVASSTRHLSPEAAAHVDGAMAPHVDGALPWGRFVARLEGRIVAADPEMAAAREEEAVRDQFAKRSRSSEHGTAGFYVRSTVGVIARLDATVAYLAEALTAFGDHDNEDLRRVKAVAILANPARAVELLAAFAALRSRRPGTGPDSELPVGDGPAESEPAHTKPAEIAPVTDDEVDPLDRMDAFVRRIGFTPTRLPVVLSGVLPDDLRSPGSVPPGFTFDWSGLLPPLTLHLHVAAETLEADQCGVVRWRGEGPVTHQFVHDHLRPLHAYRIQPVIDLAAMAPVDAYEIPDRHRRAVHLRTPADCFPFSSDTSLAVDLDHTREYDHAPNATGEQQSGQSRLENYGPLGRFHHRIKTHGRWTVRQPFPGVYLWRDPHGQLYLVDHTGTRQITAPGTAVGRATRHDPDLHVFPHTPSSPVVTLDAG